MPSRKLVAIMFTDIKGYTALMQQDERMGITIRARHRKVFDSLTPKHGGKIIQYYGDGTLSVFESAIEAVKCGMEMQLAFQEEPAIPVRIGIHMGDILFDEVEIIGNSVNVASRIESLAEAGSVFISKKVQGEIENQPNISTRSMGDFEFKNVEQPMEVFAIANEGLIVPEPATLTGKTKLPGPKIELKRIISLLAILLALGVVGLLLLPNSKLLVRPLDKSIAVLPFDDMSEQQNQGYFSDGITEDIIAHLSKIADLRVISRTSTKQYKHTTKPVPQIAKELGVSAVLEGSVRKDGDQVRITAQLIDGNTDEHIWAETYDRQVQRIFDIQTEVAREIATVLQATLTPREEQNMSKALTSDITAYDYYLRGKEALEEGNTQKDYQEAALLFQQAIAEDSTFAAAYVGLAYTTAITRKYGTAAKIWRDSALALNAKALALNPEMDEAHYLQSLYHSEFGDTEKAFAGFQKVLQINPNHGKAMIALGDYWINEGGRFEKGLQMKIEGLLLEVDRKEPRFYFAWGEVYRHIHEMEKAKKYYRQAIKLKPDYYYPLEALGNFSRAEKNYGEYLSQCLQLVKIERNTLSLDRLAWAYFYLGNYMQAETVWLELSDLVSKYDDPFFATPYKHRLAYIYWLTGRKEKALELFDEKIKDNLAMIEQSNLNGARGEFYDLGAVYAFLGQEDEALKWFRTAADSGFFSIEFIGVDPLLEDFRQTPRFQSFIKERQNIQKAVDEQNRGKLELARRRVRELEERGVLRL